MSTDLVVQDVALAPSTLFGTDNPAEVVERASGIAKTLEHVVRSQNLIVRIGQSEHVRVEGWTFLGSMLGVFPVVEWTRPVLVGEEQVGWEARVEARTRGGEVVGAAEAECLRAERTWKGRDDYALRSMAQTRAVSKALRLPLGFVMQLAGFNPTPAEEMAVIEAEAVRRPAGDAAAGTPFSYDHEEPLDPPLKQVLAAHAASDASPSSPASEAAPKLTKKQSDKLDIVVNTLRDAKLITTEQVYQSVGRVAFDQDGRPDFIDYVNAEDGRLRWRDLRPTLTKQEASDLIDRLERFAADKLPAETERVPS